MEGIIVFLIVATMLGECVHVLAPGQLLVRSTYNYNAIGSY